MLDGDGLALRFEFNKDGSVQFLSKFVRTKEFKEEEAKGKLNRRHVWNYERGRHFEQFWRYSNEKTSQIRTFYIGTIASLRCMKLDVRLKSMEKLWILEKMGRKNLISTGWSRKAKF